MPTLIVKGMAVPPKGASKKVIEFYKNTKPIDIITDWIKNRMPEYGAPPAKHLKDRVLLVEAKTASGKSTTMPVALFQIIRPSFAKEYFGPSVICTQPRILTAQTIPKGIATEGWAPDMVLGETIGFSTGPEKVLARNGLIYATVGSFLQMLRNNPYQKIASMYRFIVLDEVHERSLDFDITMMLLKKMLKDHISEPNCPFVILTSATFDIPKYAHYFEISPVDNLISVMGQSQPLSMAFLKESSLNVVNSIEETVKEIHEGKVNPMKQGQNDILIFAPGAADIRAIKAKLIPLNVKYIQEKKKCFIVLVMDRNAVLNNTKDYELMFVDDYNLLKVNDEGEYVWDGKHAANERIIISTSIAETGLTIPTLGHVIDMGIFKSMEHYAPFNIEGLLAKTAPKNSVIQRRGRAGRQFPGHFYGMYTEETWNNLEPSKLPDIVISNIDSAVLDILLQQEDCFDVEKIDMIDVPPIDALKESIEMNIVLGYIDGNYGECFKATKLGEMFRKVGNCRADDFRAILSAYVYDVCVMDLVTIIAIGDKDARPLMRKIKYSVALKESLPPFFFQHDNYMEIFEALTADDFIKELFLVEAFMNVLEKGYETAEKWCESVGLTINAMMLVLNKRYAITNDIINATLDPFYMKEKSLMSSTKNNYFSRVCAFKKCLYDGYLLNIIYNDKETRCYKNRFGLPIRAKFDRDLGHPKYLLTDKIKIDDMPGGETYNVSLVAERVSILDGYIYLDENYLEPIKPRELSLNSKEMNPEDAIRSYMDVLKLLNNTPLLASKNNSVVKYIVKTDVA